MSVAVPLYTYPDAAVLRQAVLPELIESLLAGGSDTELGRPSPMAALDAAYLTKHAAHVDGVTTPFVTFPALYVGRCAASQIACASVASFFWRLTNGFT